MLKQKYFIVSYMQYYDDTTTIQFCVRVVKAYSKFAVKAKFMRLFSNKEQDNIKILKIEKYDFE